jgi:uncharacterized LabA/DUF88 family protein
MEKNIREFFEKLLAIRDDLFCVWAPGGEHSLLEFIRLKLDERYILSVERKLKVLYQLGLLEPEHDEVGVLMRLKILRDEWDTEKAFRFFTAGGIEKKFAILVDYKNLEDNFKIPGSAVNPEVLKDFFLGLEEQILQHGKIIFPFVFIPDNYWGIAPLNQISNTFQYFPIPCQRRKVESGSIIKEADTVDAKMCELGRKLINESNITDLVIISGDADFLPLVVEARRFQKNVHVISTPNALSGRFVDISGYINVRCV